MSTLTNVFSNHIESTGVAYAGATNLAGYQFLTGGTAGEVIFRDGGASGPIRLQFNIASGSNHAIYALLPGNGIRFSSNIHITLPGTAKITIFYG